MYSIVGPAVFCVSGESVDFWQVLPVAIALVFIIEGMLPFISPNRWRAMLAVTPLNCMPPMVSMSGYRSLSPCPMKSPGM